MSHKTLGQGVVLFLFVLTLLGAPSAALAGGVCGGTYIAEKGDTVEKLAAMCGTTANAIYAANPGISSALSAGQVLTIPGLNYSAPDASVPPNNDPAYYYNYYIYYPAAGNANTYIVQYGDTFASIANKFGVSFNALWGANPQIWDINLLYAGQVIYIPAPFYIPAPYSPVTASTQEPPELTYLDSLPKNAAYGSLRLVNKSNAEVYVSLRTSRADGTSAIHEFPVSGTKFVDIPVGWIDYVAWVGGVKFTGGFKLKEGPFMTITFNKSKVVVD